LFDIEGAVGQSLPRTALRGERHQAFEDAQDAAIGDRRHAWVFARRCAAFKESKLFRIEQLAAARLDEVTRMPLVNQPEQREQLAPCATALVHGIGIERGIVCELVVETANGVADLINALCAAIGAGGKKIAILGVEHKDEPHQDGEKAFVEMGGAGGCELTNEIGRRGVEAAQQFMQGAQQLFGERGRDRSLCLPAFFQQRGKAAVARIGKQPKRVKRQFEAAKH
jgi:hypothetical protein